MLVAQHQAASAGAVFVAVDAVGVEAVGDGVGQPGELFGTVVGALFGQVGFGFVAGGGIDPAGHLVVEAPDHRDLAGTELPGFLGGGRTGQCRGQRFPGQGAPRS